MIFKQISERRKNNRSLNINIKDANKKMSKGSKSERNSKFAIFFDKIDLLSYDSSKIKN